MADMNHRAGPCSPVTLSNENAPSPFRACSHPHPTGCGCLGRSRPTQPIADPVSAGLAGIHTTTHDRLRSFTLTSSGSDDGIRRHPQDPDRPLQGLVAAGRRQPGQPDLRHPRRRPRLQERPARPAGPRQPGSTRASASSHSRPGRASGGKSGPPIPTAAPDTLQATEARLRRHLLPNLRPPAAPRDHRQRRAPVAERTARQGRLRHRHGLPVAAVPHPPGGRGRPPHRGQPRPQGPRPKPPVDPAALLGRAKRRATPPRSSGDLLAGTPPFYRDHFICLVGTGLRAGELLGLRAQRVDLAAGA